MRTVHVTYPRSDATIQIAIWSTVEGGLAITAGNLATIRPLIKWASDKLGLKISSDEEKTSSRHPHNRLPSFPLSNLSRHQTRIDDEEETRMHVDKVVDEENRSKSHVRITGGTPEPRSTEGSQEELTLTPPPPGRSAKGDEAVLVTRTFRIFEEKHDTR